MTTLTVTDPATAETLCRLEVSDADELVATARTAYPAWARTAPGERATMLRAGARRLRDAIDDLALLQTTESGKPLADSRGGVEAGIGAIEQTPSWGLCTPAARCKEDQVHPTG
jgi:succinate-semialdehyde dehydrogenase/glutarate-semialdehyde dehydrogenase